jgi:hypothetical protein
MLILCIAVIYTVNKYYENITTYLAINNTIAFDDVLAEARCGTHEKYWQFRKFQSVHI